MYFSNSKYQKFYQTKFALPAWSQTELEIRFETFFSFERWTRSFCLCPFWCEVAVGVKREIILSHLIWTCIPFKWKILHRRYRNVGKKERKKERTPIYDETKIVENFKIAQSSTLIEISWKKLVILPGKESFDTKIFIETVWWHKREIDENWKER
jgi:hypothetical protein